MGTVLAVLTAGIAAAAEPRPAFAGAAVRQIDDYAAALDAARQQEAMLLVSVVPGDGGDADDPVTRQLASPATRRRFSQSGVPWVFCRIGMSTGGKTLVQSTALAALRRGPGIFVVDQAHARWRGRVVSALPQTPGRYYRLTVADVDLLPGLPAGSLTQRSLILAVRRHPEHPQSTGGRCDELLCSAAAAHADHQARLQRQGHHGWETRSRRLRAAAGRASEVCAESWPDQDLLDSCVDCVACWRQSAGHWQAVSSPQTAYGYDLRRGGNGIWYATGIFIR